MPASDLIAESQRESSDALLLGMTLMARTPLNRSVVTVWPHVRLAKPSARVSANAINPTFLEGTMRARQKLLPLREAVFELTAVFSEAEGENWRRIPTEDYRPVPNALE